MVWPDPADAPLTDAYPGLDAQPLSQDLELVRWRADNVLKGKVMLCNILLSTADFWVCPVSPMRH